ncbi:MAG: hypothetical protein QOK40_1768 [Miltoncostaeaceae bacterium]|jgi:hypothetical protein|nr:hypothetical protein [Miltoncostaeaceae bacterium]
MAICQIIENTDLSQEQWEQVSAHVRATGPVPPEGGRLVVAGAADTGWRVVSVWESEQARDRFFAERLTPAYEAAGLSFDTATMTAFDVHTLVAGDLMGTVESR